MRLFTLLLLACLASNVHAKGKKDIPTPPPHQPDCHAFDVGCRFETQEINNDRQDGNLLRYGNAIRNLRAKLNGLATYGARLDALEAWKRNLPGDLVGESRVVQLIAQLEARLNSPTSEWNKKLGEVETNLRAYVDEKIEAEKKAREEEDAFLHRRIDHVNTRVDQVVGRETFVRTSLVAGLSLDDETSLLFLASGGISKRVGNFTADVEANFGGTQEDDGFLLGMFADLLYGDTVRGGLGIGANVNFGNNTAELVPAIPLEFGRLDLAFLLRLNLPIVVADEESDGGIDEFRIDAGVVGRF